MTAPVSLFQRAYRLVVGTLEVKTKPDQIPLKIKFSVKKNLKPEPNKAEISIWNLNPDHRKSLSQMASVPVSLEAGYEDGMSLLFLGELREAFTPREEADLITTIRSGDKEKPIRAARINHSFAKDTADLNQIFQLLATSLGVTQGNLAKAAATISATPLKGVFSRGCVLSGSASREMSGLCRSVGYTWSVQNGALQLLPLTKALTGTAIVLDQKHGMIGSPTVDNKGILSVTSLMAPDIYPGRLMVLSSEGYKGNFRIEETEHTGEIDAQEWYVQIKAKKW